MEAAEAPVIRMGQTMALIARLAISGGRSRRRGEGAAIGDGPCPVERVRREAKLPHCMS